MYGLARPALGDTVARQLEQIYKSRTAAWSRINVLRAELSPGLSENPVFLALPLLEDVMVLAHAVNMCLSHKLVNCCHEVSDEHELHISYHIGLYAFQMLTVLALAIKTSRIGSG
jgi:hypothetical protein